MLCWMRRQIGRLRQRRGLAKLDNHFLAEIGLSRVAITAVLAGAAVPLSRQMFD